LNANIQQRAPPRADRVARFILQMEGDAGAGTESGDADHVAMLKGLAPPPPVTDQQFSGVAAIEPPYRLGTASARSASGVDVM